jgi:hypothetical protein
MHDWISDLLLFTSGVVGGILIMILIPNLSAARKRRTELVIARTRMLAGIKQQHDEEILDEAFRTTEAIRGELDKSLKTLRKTLDTVLEPATSPHNGQHVVHLTPSHKPHRTV